MHGCGGESVTIALLSYPCHFTLDTIMLTLTTVIKKNNENEFYKIYVTKALRLITENLSKIYGVGEYITEDYDKILHPPKEDPRTPEEIINSIKNGVESLVNS